MRVVCFIFAAFVLAVSSAVAFNLVLPSEMLTLPSPPPRSSSSSSVCDVRFPVAHSLAVPDMRRLGLFVSSPTAYIPQTHLFAEPAYFVLTSEGIVKYAAVSSHPMGGRPNVDALLAGIAWSAQRAKEYPEFGSVVVGRAMHLPL